MTSAVTTLEIRPAQQRDFAFLASLAQDPRVTAYVGDGRPWTEDYLRQRLTEACGGNPGSSVREGVGWFIASTSALGDVGLLSLRRDGPCVEIGYWVVPAYWGQGLAGLLAQRALLMCAQAQDIQSVVARVHVDNAASRRVLERAGFLNYEHDTVHNQCIYRLSDSDQKR